METRTRVILCDLEMYHEDAPKPTVADLRLLLKNKLGAKPRHAFSNKFMKSTNKSFHIHGEMGEMVEYFQISYSNEQILVVSSKAHSTDSATFYVFDLYSKRLLQFLRLNFYISVILVEDKPLIEGGDNLLMTNFETIYKFNLRDILDTKTGHKSKPQWTTTIPTVVGSDIPFRGVRGMSIQYATCDYGKTQNILYATDFSRGQIVVLRCSDGKLLKAITHSAIHSPWAMDFNARGELLVSDFRRNEIHVLKCTLDSVQLLKSFGENELRTPRQVIVDQVTQNIMVYCQETRSICVYDRHGNYLTSSESSLTLGILQDRLCFDHFTGELLVLDRLTLDVDVLE
ncbi:hypothetical protein C9374_003436 [Naegleria lovaniensis]|uniref:Uncharacterized protein n=1 Tax=Naegleria lovaniensis TaxID=51637 RepID=A0AA88GNY4_NAELO|nr:uncharacterized protein C9374_003436 [Naegleria lovaniensis]KAG2385621.1 hypothetical protein C9374_003436 [Naegleria lovaniensis]